MVTLIIFFVTVILYIQRKSRRVLEQQKENLEYNVQERTKEIQVSLCKEQYIRKLLETTSEVNEQLSLADKIEDLLGNCCQQICLHKDYRFSHIKLLNGKYEIPIMDFYGYETLEEDALKNYYDLLSIDSSIGISLLKGEIIICGDLLDLSFTKPLEGFLKNNQIQSILLIPIMIDDIYIGFMSIFSKVAHPYEEEKIIFKELGMTISKSILSLENKQAKQKIEQEKIKNYKEMIYTLVDMTEKRDSYTAGHTRRVAQYSLLIGKAMGLESHELDLLEEAAMLHDIGKIITPDSILLKPGKLSIKEYRIIQEHVTTGTEILANIPYYHPLKNIMMYHHERYDGKGYPFGLKGDEIPLLSRVMGIADAFDAMSTNRIYKPRKNLSSTIEEIINGKGTQFDPDIAGVAIIALKNVEIDSNISQLPRSGPDYERLSFHFKDPLSGLYNKNYFITILRLGFNGHEMQCVHIISLQNFHDYIQKKGWEHGNILLKRFSESLENNFPDGCLFRIYGDHFILLNEQHTTIELTPLRGLDFIKENNMTLISEHYDIHENQKKEDLLEKLDLQL